MKPKEFRALLTQWIPDFQVKPEFGLKEIHLRITNPFWPDVRASNMPGSIAAIRCQNIMLEHPEHDFSEELEYIQQLLSIGIMLMHPPPTHPALAWFNAVFDTDFPYYYFESYSWWTHEKSLVRIGVPKFEPKSEPTAPLTLSFEKSRWWNDLSEFSEPMTTIVIFTGKSRPALSARALYCPNARPLVWHLLEMMAMEDCNDPYNHEAYNAYRALFAPNAVSDAFVEATYPGQPQLRLSWKKVDGQRLYNTWVFPKFIHIPVVNQL